MSRAVIFDLDDTLIVEEAVARESLRRAARLLPGHDGDEVVEVVLRTARRLWRSGPHIGLCADLGIASWEGLWSSFEGGHPVLEELRRWVPGYRAQAWRDAVAALAVDDPGLADDPGRADALAEAYVSSQRTGHRLIPGAVEAVTALGRRGPVGLLTNGPPDIQRVKISGCGLEGLFGAVVISGELGRGKPDASAFAAVLELLGAGPDGAVMVGDSWERDVLGAVQAGLVAVWVSGGRPLPETPPPGVGVVTTVAEVPDLLS